MLDFTPLFEAIITLIAAIITMYVIPWLKEKYSAEQLAKLRTVVDVAVYAAEKAYGAGNGDKKLEYVEQVLAVHDIRLDTIRLKALVDSAIKRMENEERGGVTIIENIGDAVMDDEEENAEVL